MTVTFVGEVSKQGAVQLDQSTGLLQALGQAGGPSQYANKSRIFVLRQFPQFRRIRFTYAALIRNEAARRRSRCETVTSSWWSELSCVSPSGTHRRSGSRRRRGPVRLRFDPSRPEASRTCTDSGTADVDEEHRARPADGAAGDAAAHVARSPFALGYGAGIAAVDVLNDQRLQKSPFVNHNGTFTVGWSDQDLRLTASVGASYGKRSYLGLYARSGSERAISGHPPPERRSRRRRRRRRDPSSPTCRSPKRFWTSAR